MLTWFVHKDAVKDALSAMLPPEPEVGPEKAPEGTEPKEDGKP